MSGIIAIWVIVVLIALVLLLMMEQGGQNYVGDYSMAPGCFLLGIVGLAIIILIGFLTGNISVHVR